MHIRLVTLFPDAFEGPLRTGLVGRALARGDVEVSFTSPRDFASDRHRTVDDQPYGGGGGMVLRVEPWAAAIEAQPNPGPVVLLTPQGAPLRQAHFERWAEAPGLTLVAGRYEGFDERLRTVVTEEVSLGDFILTGGEAAAFVIIDGVVRLRPGTLGNADSPHLDSFSSGLDGLLEYPHYTRPATWRRLEVPEVLRSGDHARIEQWRRVQSVLRTAERRPDRLLDVALTPADRAVVRARRALASPPAPTLVLRWPPPVPLPLLWELAAAYGVVMELVAEGAAAAEAGAQAIDALPDRALAPPDGARRRRRRRAPEASAAPASDALVVAAAWMRAVATPTPVPPGERVARLDEPPERRAPRRPASALRRGWRWVWGEGLHEQTVEAQAPAVRASAGGETPSPEVALPVQLDRILGEG